MAIPRYLPNAPITEAIVDIQAKPSETFQVDRFVRLTSELRERYPTVQQRRAGRAELQIKDDRLSTTATEPALVGYFFKSEDQLNVAQFRVDGFTFNRLRPYASWELIFPEAMKLWRLYFRIADPKLVTRIALRYINHLRLPLPIDDFERYLTAPPMVPQGLPQRLSGFLTRVVIHDPERGLAANVTQALELRVTDPDHVTVIIDIDAYKRSDFEPNAPGIERTFQVLHDFKNDIFFKSITEETARLFE